MSLRERCLALRTGGLVLAILCFAGPICFRLVRVYEHQEDYAHGWLVPLILVGVWFRRRAHFHQLEQAGTPWGLGLGAAGVGLVVLGIWYEAGLRPGGFGVEFIAGLGLLISLVGTLLGVHGWARTWCLRFGLLFMFFAVPWPESWTLGVTLPMRSLVAWLTDLSLTAIGLPVLREGNILHLDRVSLGIEDACSGLRSLWSLLACSIAVGWLYRLRTRVIVGLALLAIPVSIIQNAFRVSLTGFLANELDDRFLEGWRHEALGWGTFLLAAVLLVVLANRFPPLPDDATVRRAPRPAGTSRLLPFFGVLFLSGAGAQLLIQRHYGVSRIVELERKTFREFPVQLDSFREIKRVQLPERMLNMLKPDDHLVAWYGDFDGREVRVLMFYWLPRSRGAYGAALRPHAPEVCYPASGWNLPEEIQEVRLPDSRIAQLFAVEQGPRRRLVLSWRDSELEFLESAYPGGLKRVRALMDSWQHAHQPLPPQFSVILETDLVYQEVDSRNLLLRCAGELGSRLKEFGITER